MSQSLPARPNLEHLKNQAKDLLKSARADDPAAISRLAVVAKPPFSLAQAQLALAREYGFESWSKLLIRVEEIRAYEGITPEVVKNFVQVAVSDRVDRFGRLLDLYPGLPSHDPVTALLCGNVAFVRDWVTPERAITPIGDVGLPPIAYLCYSRIHRVRPEAYDGVLECARLLLDAGADPNTSHEEGGVRLPILFGATSESQHLRLTRLLLERGAKPNDGESVYHAAQRYQPEILETLLEFGANISGMDSYWGNTPLYFLSGHRPTDSGAAVAMQGFKWLLEHGADPNIPCRQNGETPLQSICVRGWGRETVELLLRHGADPDRKRDDGRSAYVLASAIGNVEAAETLSENGADTTLSEEERAVAALAAGGSAALPAPSPLLNMLFVRLAEVGNLAGVRSFLDAGMDPNSLDKEGVTALHYAGFCGWCDIAELLLSHGASHTIVEPTYKADPFGWTLHGFMHARSPIGDYVGVLRAILRAGGDPARIVDELEHEDAPNELAGVLAETQGQI